MHMARYALVRMKSLVQNDIRFLIFDENAIYFQSISLRAIERKKKLRKIASGCTLAPGGIYLRSRKKILFLLLFWFCAQRYFGST